MSYISIYRKYRPQSFSEVVGQDEIVKTLQNSIKSSRLSHAYIFCGPRGTGKTTTARIFAKAVNCLNNVDKKGKVISPEPCNKCSNCLDITNGMSVDLIEIDAASNTGIDNVRKLIENAQYLPNFLRKKIYIIDEIHNIGGGTTKAAFHALLKILEEPPENVIFILATTEPQKVIPTILSRCQRFDFKPIKADDIKKRLKIISTSENIEVSDTALNLISKYSDGSQRDANVILEKIASLDDDKVQVEDVVSLLGAVDLEILFELAGILIESNSEEAGFFISRLEKLHQNLEVFVEKFIEHLQNLYFVKNNPEGFDYV
ncbi:MAG: DNA polymerase III subunit gamma/tau, partial [Actinomycetota bacterium]|nr:DNA polymerase III subunit gamma/tau [Actinomycetota bacterium]